MDPFDLIDDLARELRNVRESHVRLVNELLARHAATPEYATPYVEGFLGQANKEIDRILMRVERERATI